jgi:hypothetical protein
MCLLYEDETRQMAQAKRARWVWGISVYEKSIFHPTEQRELQLPLLHDVPQIFAKNYNMELFD